MFVHRIGFTELSQGRDAKDRPYQANIIFVHGLRGHPQHTWEDNPDRGRLDRSTKDTGRATPRKRDILKKAFFKSKTSSPASLSATPSVANSVASEERPNKLFWPDDYLTQDIPEARVWTYGYNADAIGGVFEANNKNSVSQHGRDLSVLVEREIRNEDPILFVAHSLGGIIVKDAIRRSEKCRARTKLVVFLGTPHRGSTYAGWGEIASNLALLALQDSNKQIIKTLEVNNEVLDNIHEDFKSIADHSRIRIHSFQEAQGISGMRGLHSKVVDDFSSKLDLPRTLETVESIDANHMQMARCSDRADPQYRAIVGVLQQSIHDMVLDDQGTRLQGTSSRGSKVEANVEKRVDKMDGVKDHATPPCHYIPLPENPRFVGRDRTLKNLKEMLFDRKECRKAAIVGLGGAGKTQAALHLAYWTKKHRPEFSIFWVPVLSNATFEEAFTVMARNLPIQSGDKGGDVKESVRQYLSSETAGPWLLVVDNADDGDVLLGSADIPGSISQYLPESGDGFTLFTTRSREIAVSVAGSDVIELDKMDPPEAAEFLENSLIQKDMVLDKTAMAKLLEELTYLPLAITQAAAYINIKQLPLAEYVELLHGTQQDIIDLMSKEFRDNTRYPGSQNAVATTWLVSFDQIRKSNNAAADLLSFISCIEPKGIPQSLLPSSESTAQLVDAIGTLCTYAFLTRRGGSKVFDMHSLVHLATRIWVQREGLTATTDKKATRHLATVFPSDDYTNRNVWREYLPHAFKVLQQTKELDMEERSGLLLGVGRCLKADGRIEEAIRSLEEAYHWKACHLAEDHPSRLASQHSLALAYTANGQAKEAITLLKQVVAIQARTLTEDHLSKLSSQHALAQAYRANGQAEEAIALLEQVVTIQARTLAEDHHSQLASQHSLALAYGANGMDEEAITLFNHVVAIQARTPPEDDPAQLASRHELAMAYAADGQAEEAITLLKQVVAIQARILNEDHPSRLKSQHGLAVAYRANGQAEEAIALLKHVVAFQARTPPEDHPAQLASRHELAMAYAANGQAEEAITLLKQVVARQARTLNEDHPLRLTFQHSLALAYHANLQVKEAVTLLELVVTIKAKTLAEDHPERLVSEQALAHIVNDVRTW